MPDYKTKSALIADWGLFSEIAPRLGRDFGEVKYFVPWASAYPKAASAFIGYGLPGVTRVETFWDHVADADIVIFPDIYFADVQEVIRERYRKPVWGHGYAESLELDRWGTRQFQEAIGLPAPKTEYISGVDGLEDYLKHTQNQWVKISTYRGDGETFHHEDWHTTSIYLDQFRNRVGALQSRYEFMVEEAIDDAIEIGYDGFQVAGEWPPFTYYGFEVKDKGYIGRFVPYDDLPKQLRKINAAMTPILEKEGRCGFLSFEFRLTRDGTAYMIDPCLRNGSPPFEGLMEGYTNLSEIIWEGAHGRIAEPKAEGEYLAMAMVHSPFALTNWVPISVPDDVRRWLKLRNAAVIRKKLYHVPNTQGEMPEIGAVVGIADSLEGAIDLVRDRAEQVSGFGLEIHVEALEDAQAEIDKAKEYGIEF